MKYEAADAFHELSRGTPERPVVVAQLGQTLDGRIATVTGASKYISGAEALDHLHRLRAAVDAVVVGVGTVVADDPLLTVRRVPGRSPARIVIDPHGRMPADAKMLHDDGPPIIALCGPGVTPVPKVEVIRVPTLDGRFSPFDIIEALGGRGFARILVEGGADTLGRFLDAGRLDVLHLLVAPMILGSGKSGLSLRPISCLSEALRPQTRVHVFDDGDVLFTCDMRPQLRAAE